MARAGEGELDVGDVPRMVVVDGMESDRRQREGEKRRLSTGGRVAARLDEESREGRG